MADYDDSMLTARAPIPVRKPWPYVKVKADATGKTEVSAVINAAINSLPEGGGDVVVPRGVYLIEPVDNGVRLRSNMRFVLEDGAILQAQTNDDRRYGVLRVNGVTNVVVQGGMGAMILGDRDTHVYQDYGSDALNTHEWGHCIQCLGSSHVSFFDMHLEAATGDGISAAAFNVDDDKADEPCDDIFISGGVFTRNRRQGVSIGRGTRFVIQKVEISEISGTGPGAGIDIEPTSKAGEWVTEDVIVEDCYIHHCKSAGVLMWKGAEGTTPIRKIYVRRNRIEFNNLGVQVIGANDYWILGNRITNHNASGIVLGKLSKDSHVHENTLGFNYAKQGVRDRVDFEYTGWKTALSKDIFIAADASPNDIGLNFYI